ncbi:hypothetical protein bcgnr5385_48360 [Bacillus cereus]
MLPKLIKRMSIWINNINKVIVFRNPLIMTCSSSLNLYILCEIIYINPCKKIIRQGISAITTCLLMNSFGRPFPSQCTAKCSGKYG